MIIIQMQHFIVLDTCFEHLKYKPALMSLVLPFHLQGIIELRQREGESAFQNPSIQYFLGKSDTGTDVM